MGTVRDTGRSCSTSNWSLLASSQEGVQHRQTYPCLSGNFFDVGPRNRNRWQLASQTDQCINGAAVGVSRPFLDQGVSPNEEYAGETNCQDNAWYAVHVPFLSEKTSGKIVLPVHAPRRTPKRKQNATCTAGQEARPMEHKTEPRRFYCRLYLFKPSGRHAAILSAALAWVILRLLGLRE